jgi:uridine phosphorylase
MSEDSLYPIIDFDPDREAIIRPFMNDAPPDFPEHVVMCFFKEVVEKVAEQHYAKTVYVGRSEVGLVPYYEINYEGKRLGFFQALVGAPLAVGFMEKAITMGGKRFIACGGSGVLNPELAVGHLLIPTAAIRDEGTSYHYLPPASEIKLNEKVVKQIEKVVRDEGLEYLLTKTWTTDAFYRETKNRVERYKRAGCDCVEMEAAAMAAVAEFYGVEFGAVFYGGDLVQPDGWDHRGWNNRTEIRENLFWLAVKACLSLKE